MRFLRQSLTIASKDLRSEFRSKETINASVSFAVVILLLFSFAFEPSSEQLEDLTGGLLWLVFAFAGALVVNRSFARDLPNDCLDTLIASPSAGRRCSSERRIKFRSAADSGVDIAPDFRIVLQRRLDATTRGVDDDDRARDLGYLGCGNNVQRDDRQSTPARVDVADASLSDSDSVPVGGNLVDGGVGGGEAHRRESLRLGAIADRL